MLVRILTISKPTGVTYLNFYDQDCGPQSRFAIKTSRHSRGAYDKVPSVMPKAFGLAKIPIDHSTLPPDPRLRKNGNITDIAASMDAK